MQRYIVWLGCALLAVLLQVGYAGEKIKCFRCIGKDGCKTGDCDGRACVKYIEKLDDGYNYKYECEQRKPDPEEEICSNVDNTGDGIIEIQKKKCLCATSYCNGATSQQAGVAVAIASALLAFCTRYV